ncbi:hypothetical protein HPP92_016111 [Vanilla planifolia]|uniref:DCL protein n=1 Tax=Vanilla planifolia TaxID=51239 RepID=A0A835UT16_VANPL|nr:hypothetical protein HPP92_016111 [Vanilla planifolia]
MASVTVHSLSLFHLCKRSFLQHVVPSSSSTSNLSAVAALRVVGVKVSRYGSASGDDPDSLRRPVVSPVVEEEVISMHGEEEPEEEAEFVDWEDQILEETVPLAGFARMLLHSGEYDVGDRLTPEHEKTVLEKLLIYHPESEWKIGCGIDHIKVDLHPEFLDSRCLFIVRKDGESIDFSFWKCIKGLIRKKYPIYADSFILRHFRRKRHMDE